MTTSLCACEAGEKVKVRHACDATLLKGGATRVEDVAIDQAEIVTVAYVTIARH